MSDLTDEQKAALVEAYESGMRVAIERDAKDVGPTLKSQRLVYMDGAVSVAGEILAQSLIRERDLRKEIKDIRLAPCTDVGPDATGEYDVICDICGDSVDHENHTVNECARELAAHRDRLLNTRCDFELEDEKANGAE